MTDPSHDVEEIVLFPDSALEPARAWTAEVSSSEVGSDGGLFAELRDWMSLQMAHVDGQLRKQKPRARPPDMSGEVEAYFQALVALEGMKATRAAYTKALNKLDYIARRPG